MCGPSTAEKNIASSQSAFFQNLMASYNQNFGEQQGILSSLTSALAPILQGGPNQMGFSASENAALTGSAINNAAAANRNAQVVAAQSAGGNTGVTTGGQKQLQAAIATGTGQGLASNLNQINLENARTGRQNFFGAEAGLAGVADLENPLGYAGQANNAGGTAFGEAKTVQQENNQVGADIGGLVTGIGGSVLEGLSGGGGLKDVLSSVAGGL